MTAQYQRMKEMAKKANVNQYYLMTIQWRKAIISANEISKVVAMTAKKIYVAKMKEGM